MVFYKFVHKRTQMTSPKFPVHLSRLDTWWNRYRSGSATSDKRSIRCREFLQSHPLPTLRWTQSFQDSCIAPLSEHRRSGDIVTWKETWIWWRLFSWAWRSTITKVFNFREFDPAVDPHESSIQLLLDSGIDFDENMRNGVCASYFARLFYQKVLLPYRHRIKWITFHGLYDMGYVVKLLMGRSLPEGKRQFLCRVQNVLGSVYDVKVHDGVSRI